MLGVYVLQRHRGARVALSVLAVPILLTAPLTGGFLGALVAAGDADAVERPRAGLVRRPPGPPAPADAAAHRRSRPPSTADPRPRASLHRLRRPTPPADPGRPRTPSTRAALRRAPGATAGLRRSRPGADQRAPRAGRQPSGRPPRRAQPAVPPQRAGDRRCRCPVKVACVLTWVFSGLVALLYAGVMVALSWPRTQIVDYVVDSPAWQRANLAARPARAGALAGLPDVPRLVRRRAACSPGSPGAGTTGPAACSRPAPAAALVAGLLAFPVGLLHQLAAALTIAGLFGAPARAWFAAAAPGLRPPHGPPPGLRVRRLAARPAASPATAGPTRASRRSARTASRRSGDAGPSGAQACRSAARSRRMPSSSTSCSLQNAHRTRCRPSSEPSS